jgi:hypothetical protein
MKIFFLSSDFTFLFGICYNVIKTDTNNSLEYICAGIKPVSSQSCSEQYFVSLG